MLEAGTYVVVEDIRDSEAKLVPAQERFEIVQQALDAAEFTGYLVDYEVLPSDVQALKHFDELLRAAQELVNDADPDGFDGHTLTLHVEKAVLDGLKAIIQKISDEAVEIIQGLGKDAVYVPGKGEK